MRIVAQYAIGSIETATPKLLSLFDIDFVRSQWRRGITNSVKNVLRAIRDRTPAMKCLQELAVSLFWNW